MDKTIASQTSLESSVSSIKLKDEVDARKNKLGIADNILSCGTTWTELLILYNNIELKIFELLRKLGHSASLQQLVQCIGETCNERKLKALLDHTVDLGYLENEEGRYVLTKEAGMLLTEPSTISMVPFIRYMMKKIETMKDIWKDIKEGDQIKENGQSEDYFSPEEKEEAMRLFQEAMNAYLIAETNSPINVLEMLDLSSYHSTIDLGGGFGVLQRYLVSKYPQMKAVVFELPHVVKLAEKIGFPGVEFCPGDFFEPLPTCDLFILGHTLHNWDDEACTKILTNVYNALTPGGAVLILESVMEEDRRSSRNSVLHEPKVSFAIGGRERSFREYVGLLQNVGFRNFEVTKNPKKFNLTDAIISKKTS